MCSSIVSTGLASLVVWCKYTVSVHVLEIIMVRGANMGLIVYRLRF